LDARSARTKADLRHLKTERADVQNIAKVESRNHSIPCSRSYT